MNLTDDEMRVKCAEAMGWTRTVSNGVRIDGWVFENSFYYEPFDYPDDPAAALTLCDRLREEGWTVQINGFVTEGWHASFHKGEIHHSVSDPSLARAICLAFLKCHE